MDAHYCKRAQFGVRHAASHGAGRNVAVAGRARSVCRSALAAAGEQRPNIVHRRSVAPSSRPSRTRATRYDVSVSGGRRTASRASPTTEVTARIGTAARAARGGRTSSKRGTGSPNLRCSGPSGQLPRPITSAAPSTTKAAPEKRSSESRRRVSAHVQTYPRPIRSMTAMNACAARKPLAARPSRASTDGVTAWMLAGLPRTPTSRRSGQLQIA